MPSRKDEPERRTAAAVMRWSLSRRPAQRAAEPAQEGHTGIGLAHLHAFQDRIGAAQARRSGAGQERSWRCSARAGACSADAPAGIAPDRSGRRPGRAWHRTRRGAEQPCAGSKKAFSEPAPIIQRKGNVDAAEMLAGRVPQSCRWLRICSAVHKASAGACAAHALLVERQEKTADRIGREAAIIDQLRPLVVAGLHRVLAEGAQQVAGLHDARPCAALSAACSRAA